MNENRKAENKYLHGETESKVQDIAPHTEPVNPNTKSYESKVMDGMEKK